MNDNVYEEILSRSNIQTILEHYGLKINKDKTTCPFHKDNHPSMYVNRDKNIVKCFSCGTGGNAITFIKKYENIRFKEAMQKAIDIQHLDIVIPSKSEEKLTPEQEKKQQLSGVIKEAIKYTKLAMSFDIEESKKAQEYLKNRKISQNTINTFHIGYAPKLSNGIVETLKKQNNVEDLIDVGLAKKGTNKNINNVFFERIVVPILDEHGNAVGFGARAINDKLKPKYINTSSTLLFDKSKVLFNYNQAKAYAKNDELIILEGYLDVISSKEMGIDNSIALMGTAITDYHIKLIKKLNCEVILSLDNDEAGKTAMIRIIPELTKQGIQVSVFDIASLGEYKDFGDLHMAGVTREQIYATKTSGFTYLIQEKYVKGKPLTVENISAIFKNMKKDNLIKDTKDELNFVDYIINNSDYSKEEIDKILHPQRLEQESRVGRYKDIIFYYYIIDKIRNYAIKNENRILIKFIELGKLNSIIMEKNLDNENFLKDGELTINIAKYVNEFLINSKEYLDFKNDKAFQFEELLNNVKMFDENGKIVDVVLTMEQKEMVLKQYNESFAANVKEYIENNPEEFKELFIANSNKEYEKLFPDRYVEQLKENSVKRFAIENTMGAIRYRLAYEENLKSVMSEKYVNNEQYKSLLVFNNIKGEMLITEKNIKKEVSPEIEKTKEPILEEAKYRERAKTTPMSIVMKLTGNEKQTYKGIYFPINENMEIYIPKQLYKMKDNELELVSSESNLANMSEYSVDQEQHIKKFQDRLTFKDFCHKYANLYEVRMEQMKEVMA